MKKFVKLINKSIDFLINNFHYMKYNWFPNVNGHLGNNGHLQIGYFQIESFIFKNLFEIVFHTLILLNVIINVCLRNMIIFKKYI